MKLKVKILKGESVEYWKILNSGAKAIYTFPEKYVSADKVDGITPYPKLKTQENPDYTKALEGFY